MTTRRRFLQSGLWAGGLVLGWRQLAAAAPGRDDATWAMALAEMKAGRSWGLGIVISQDADARIALGRQLATLINRSGHWFGGEGWSFDQVSELALVLHEVRFFCATAEELAAQPSESVVLVDGAGRRVAGADLDFGASASDLFARLRTLLDGDGRRDRRLAPFDLPALRETLAVEDPERSRDLVVEAMPTHGPAMVHLCRKGPHQLPPVARGSVQGVALDRVRYRDPRIEEQPALDSDPLDPVLGAQWERGEGHFPCPTCGLGSGTVAERKFMSFFSKDTPR